MTQAIEILERHRQFLIEVEREGDVQDAIKAVAIEIERLRELVKRHEDALDAVCGGKVTCYRKDGDSIYYCFWISEISTLSIGDTPLVAIEAAMKEEK